MSRTLLQGAGRQASADARAGARTGIIVRAATVEDAHQIAQIDVASYQAAYPILMPSSFLDARSVSQRQETWMQRLVTGAEHVLVCEAAGQMEGWTSISAADDLGAEGAAEILGLCVRPVSWRQGCGTALLLRALNEIRLMGRAAATVWIVDGNLATKSFYRRCGFARDGSSKTLSVGTAVLTQSRYRVQL